MGFRGDYDHLGGLGAKQNRQQQLAEVEMAQVVDTKVTLKAITC